MATTMQAQPRHAFQTDDPRLKPIAEKVFARARLSLEEGITLYLSPDILALGWLANHVRQRMHGNVTFFNVNRPIIPTDVCAAACPLCAFRSDKQAPTLSTLA